MDYPIYYRKENRCLKRETDTTAIEVKVPESYRQALPTSHGQVTFPDKERLDEEVSKMELVNQEIYEGYLYKFFLQSDNNKAMLDQIRLNRKHLNSKS